MWIKKEGCDAVNLDRIENIACQSYSGMYYIGFYGAGLSVKVSYGFNTKEERDTYYNVLMELVSAQEINPVKLQ